MTLSQVTPKNKATLITTSEQALNVARELAQVFRTTSAQRDRQRELPFKPLEALFASGLGAITVPAAFGGAAVPTAVLAKVISLLSEADAAIGQIPQNHFYALEVLRVNGSEAQQQRFYQEVLAGVHLGNALAEFSSPAAHHRFTSVLAKGDAYQLNGRKFYATGALFADRIPAAARDAEGKEQLVFVPRFQAGVSVIDDWSGFGQRTTGSGTVTFDAVQVNADDIVPFQRAFERPTTVGPFAQIMHAAIDYGIARAAFSDMLNFINTRARPWPDSGVAQANDDPLIIDRVGQLAADLQAAEALLDEAGDAIDFAQKDPQAESVAAASIQVACARAWTTERALEAANLLFELSGTRAALAEHNFDRHWRNARTHTLHDPVRWKYPIIGNYVLNGVLPPRRGTL
ncbi:SfnB family sulfur acquisition oxidoreductase [Erwinia oleae]|uniref:SfnB family sulfur acquisition oxidoreductase n=1 Tax=Erwinia oleae TaxID=796334 RepID=UPI0005522091|nr:SfnB family sulfur acquisition oxidoreductase [Erwinia oleae]